MENEFDKNELEKSEYIKKLQTNETKIEELEA